MVMKAIGGVVAMAMVYLTCTSTRLLGLSPGCLNSFSAVAADSFGKAERKLVLAILLVALEMLFWDKEMNDIDCISEIREVGLKTRLEIDVVPICRIVALNNP